MPSATRGRVPSVDRVVAANLTDVGVRAGDELSVLLAELAPEHGLLELSKVRRGRDKLRDLFRLEREAFGVWSADKRRNHVQRKRRVLQ